MFATETSMCFRLFVGRELSICKRLLAGFAPGRGQQPNLEEVIMTKLATFTGLALLLAVSYATAQQNTMSAGRPSAVLTPDQCNAIWSKAVPSGDTLAQANAAPYIVNFAQVDTNNDGNIDKKEFDAACAKGMVKNPQ
jgi:hypothetical protein